MTKLSVNINKVASLRNTRGGDVPNVLNVALDCERFGAEGITVHPRPDERHIRYQDVRDLRPALQTEFNIEGNPIDKFMELVLEVAPHQATLVPDSPKQLTSNAGWDTKRHCRFLRATIDELHKKGIRTSIFVDTSLESVRYAAETGTDRIELYTEPYASLYPTDRATAVAAFVAAAKEAHRLGLGINAGHDLSLLNLNYFYREVPNLLEVSIGHALIADALYFGLENTIQLYKRQLQ